VEQAKKEIKSFDEFIERLQTAEKKEQRNHLKIDQFQKAFKQAMDDDFNTSKALGVIFTLIKQANILLDKDQLGKEDIKNILIFLKDVDKIFGFIFGERKKNIPSEVLSLVKEREKYREAKDFAKADELRVEIKKLGYTIDDTPHGPAVKKIK